MPLVWREISVEILDCVIKFGGRRFRFFTNIAEGFERGGNKEFLQFLAIAKGSCGEVRAQLYVALDQNYIDKICFDEILNKLLEVSRIISGLMKYLQQSEMRGDKFK